MTYLIDSSNRSIVIDDVLLTKEVISFLDFTIRGEVTTNFSIPNSSGNRSIIGYRGLNQLNRVLEKELDLYRNGNKVASGKIVIQEDTGSSLDGFFIAGNSSWINDFTGNIRDLDLSDYDTTFSVANIQSRTSATDGIIFPLVDWIYRGQKLSDGYLVKPILASGENYFFDFYPCIYLHTIVTRLFRNKNIKLSGDLFTDPIYNKIILPINTLTDASLVNFDSASVSGLIRANPSTLYSEALTIPTGVLTKITFNQALYSGTDLPNNRLLMDAAYDSVNLVGFLNFYGELRNGTIAIYKNGASIGSKTFTNASSVTHTVNTPVSASDYIELYVTLTDTPIFPDHHITDRYLNWSTTYQVASAGGTVTAASILPDISEIDLVKYLSQRFNCLLDYDAGTQTLDFKILDNVRKEDAVDYTENLKSYTISYQTGFGLNNYVRSKESEELTGYKIGNLSFGDRNLEGSGSGDKTPFEIPFRPSASVQNTNLGLLQTYSPLITLTDNDEGDAYSTGGATFTGLNKTDYAAGSVIRIQDDNGTVAFAVIETATVSLTSTITVYGSVTATLTTGRIYRQTIALNNQGLRELIVVPSTSLASLGKSSVKLIDTTTGAATTVTSLPFAYYAKPSTGVASGVDDLRVGLNFGAVSGASNISFGDLYLNTLSKIVQAPVLNAKMLFSESEYKNINMKGYVYLKTKDFNGYFLPKTLEGYKDRYTEVKFELYFIE